MIHRQNNVLKTVSSKPDFAASYTVLALPVGAVASAASSGTTATVDAGHGFAVGDLVLIFRGTTNTFVNEAIASVTGTTIVWTAATPTVALGNLMCNLGPDPGSGGSPDYDASPMVIYSDSDGSTAITNSTVTTDTTGNYSYYSNGDGRNWELIRDSGGTVAGVVPGWGGVSGQLNPCDFGCVPDDSTANQDRMKVAADAAANTKQTFHGPAGDFRMTGQLLLPADFTAVNDPWFRLIRAWSSGSASTAGAMVVSSTFSSAAAGASTSDDNIHWQGGRMTVTVANTFNGSMIALHSDLGSIKDIIIEEWGDNTTGGFACHLYGNYGWIDNVQAYSTTTLVGGTDGIGRAAGIGGGITNCRVKSSDDCYTVAVWFGSGIQDKAATDMVISNCYGESTGARLVSTHTATGGSTTANIERVAISNLTGKSKGQLVNANIGHASSTSVIKHVTVDGVVAIGASTNAAERIVRVDGSGGTNTYQIEDYHISRLQSTVSTNATPATGQVYFTEVNRGSFNDNTIDGSSMNAAMTAVVYAFECQNLDVCDNKLRMSTTAASTNVAAIWLGVGSAECTTGECTGNTVIDLPTNGIGIDVEEATAYNVSGNVVRIASGAGTVIGIRDLGGTVEGNNVVTGNNLSDWLALEAADKAAAVTTLTNDAISQLNEGDTAYANNVGHDLVGFETYTAATTQTQVAGTLLRAAVSYVSTVANAADAVTLPYAFHGRRIEVHNAGANSLQIFPGKGDAIEALGADNSTNLTAANSPVIFVAVNKTQWINANGATLT